MALQLNKKKSCQLGWETFNEQYHSMNHNFHESNMYLLLSIGGIPPRRGLAIRPKLSALLADFWAIANER